MFWSQIEKYTYTYQQQETIEIVGDIIRKESLESHIAD